MSFERLNCAPNIFLVFSVSFVCGIGVFSIFDLSGLGLHLGVLLASFILLATLDRRKWMFLFFCLWGISLGFWKMDVEISKIQNAEQKKFFGIAEISRVPEQRKDYQILVMKPAINSVDFGKAKFQILTDPQIKYEYGEILSVSCQLQKAENKYDGFDYQRFLASKKIYQICKNAQIEKTNEIAGNSILKRVFQFREIIEQKISQYLPLPESSYLAGLLLGGSERLPDDVGQQFQRTGMTHAVAASGYNITILASAIIFLAIFAGMWRGHAIWLALVGIIFFVLMIGAPSSAVRAAIMGALVLWAAKNGRLANSLRAIIFAGAIMCFNAPMILVYDVGFQLSFLATIGIITIYGPLAERFKIQNDFLEFKSIVLVTIAAQLGVMGIIIYSFESFSPISLFANLVILPFIPYIMFGGIVMILLEFIFPLFAKMLSALVWLALHSEIKTIEFLSHFSWASVQIKKVHWLWLLGYYIFFFFFILWMKKKKVTELASRFSHQK